MFIQTQSVTPIFFIESANIDYNILAVNRRSRPHNCADCLGDLAVFADNHTHIILGNAENQLYLATINGLGNGNGVGIINDRFRNIAQGFFQIGHKKSPFVSQRCWTFSAEPLQYR